MRAFLPLTFTALLLGAFATPLALPAEAQTDRETTVDQMSPGSAKAYVVGIQEELKELGYHPGPVDGVEGSRTRAAIRSYQHNAGLKVTGRASKELLEHMRFSSGKAYAKPPQVNPMVLEAQTLLAKRGYYQDKLDGILGPATRGAIGAYQSDSGMPVDGRLSPQLLESLRGAPPMPAAPTQGSVNPARQT